MLRIIRAVLAAEGLVLSWRTFQSTRRLEDRREHGDQSVREAVALTPQARLFNLPNPFVASAYFALVLFLSLTGLADRSGIRRPLALASWTSLGISGYLVYQLVFVLRKNCPLCMRSHLLNLALTSVVTAQAASAGRARK